MNYIRRYKYIIVPSIFLFACAIFKYKFSMHINIGDRNIDMIVNLSGILAGFLFTTMGILISLPKNRFTDAIKGTRTLKSTYITIFSAVVFLFISMILGIIKPCEYIIVPFLIGLTNTLLSAFDLFMIGYLSSKSK